MKLQSTPKPVRFRISSGGQEHSSLESLLSCFDYNELKSLKSQLIQWLERQGPKGNEIAGQLENCDTMPPFEETIKLFYGHDCDIIIKDWFEIKSANLRFVDLDLIKNSQRLLSIAYLNKDLMSRRIDDNQWLAAINTHNRIDDIDLLNIKSKIELEIEKNKLRKEYEKKQQEEQRREEELKASKISTIRFRISRPGSIDGWEEITEITGITRKQLLGLYKSGQFCPRIQLNEIQIERLKPLIDDLKYN